jgi:polyribonucleotide nucleotidyltransferase
MTKEHTATTMLGNKQMTLEIGKLAPKSTVSILGRIGDTCVLTTVVVGRESTLDYFPLSVEYVEKLYAGGRIKGSRWVKREGKPTDEAVLKGRVIDRSIRPLFPKGYKREVQIVCTLLSYDEENAPDMLAAITVSAGLHISNIPWAGPIATSRVAYMGEGDSKEFVLNPSEKDMDSSDFDLVVSSDTNSVYMIETQAKEVPEKILIEGIKKAKEENKKTIEFIESLRKEVGMEKDAVPSREDIDKVKKLLKSSYEEQMKVITVKNANHDADYNKVVSELIDEIFEKEQELIDKKKINEAIETVCFDIIRDDVLDNQKRYDGRKLDEVRPLYIASDVLPRTHGSAIFQRGLTQVMSIATLGSTSLEQLLEGPEGEESKRYMHHYFSPPYSYGETGRMGWPGRREIGHGALAEKAIEPVLPSKDEFPYAIRVVSEVLSSNGSTSMASTCGSSLALMDAGVPIKAQVAGISIGLMRRSDDDYVLLTDIAGIEDFSGYMDFKVAGTEQGVTAIQLDVKDSGLTDKMIDEIFVRAKTARTFILSKMNAIIDKPRAQVSEYAPKVVMLTPPEEKIGEIIGPGGKNIKRIIAATETDINISDDGKVSISGVNREGVERAVEAVKSVYREIQVGEEFDGTVTRILPIGALVEFMPGRQGLVHISKLSKDFIKDAREVVSEGDVIKVKVAQIDNQGRYNLALAENK